MFAAILSTDGSPVDPHGTLLRSSGRVEILGSHRQTALLLAAPDSQGDQDWHELERWGSLWIAGRIRLDGRDALRARLGVGDARPSDGLLCLHAYAKWGGDFVDCLAGDFSFALWDDAQSLLVCARDQMGVRCLFHAEVDARRFVSDSLDWIATHGAVDRTLDDYWVADFLCVGRSLDFHRTVYRSVNRLPPAHSLTLAGADASLRRYWRLAIEEPVYFRDSRLYTERFVELLSASIADRLPTGRVGVSMSGGIDSTTLAAVALGVTGTSSRVVAECTHYERLMPDDEAHFASIAARALGIELQLRAVDDLTYDPLWRSRSIRTAEPTLSIVAAHFDRSIMGAMARRARVWFQGEGPDNALSYERDAYLSWLSHRGDWARLAGALMQHAMAKGIASWRTSAHRFMRRQAEAGHSDPPSLPVWLDGAFAARLHLEERIAHADDMVDRTHPWHPRAMGSFIDPMWQRFFNERAQEEAVSPLRWRFPYFDLRVLQFLLSVPPVPWGYRKELIRKAMGSKLPRDILERNKAPLAGSALLEPVNGKGLGELSSPDRLGRYLDAARLPRRAASHAEVDGIIAAHALDYWLQQRTP